MSLPAVQDDLRSDSDGDDYSDVDDDNVGFTTKLENIGRGKLKGLNLVTDYVRNWKIWEAFREVYQNWRDGILRSFKIHLSQFRTEHTDEKRVILIKAFKADSTQLLGFISFKYNKEGQCIAGLKIANFNATLEYRSLGTGATSKAEDSNQSGQHGEGMKLSALIFRRNNYNYRIESGGFKWNFIFKNGEFACGLRRMGVKTLDRLKDKEKGKPRTEISHPWKDVCVIIGAPGMARKITGVKVQGNRLHVDQFRAMLKVTLDINPPAKIIRTPGGARGTAYKYGYNFLYGVIDRDRESLDDPDEESEQIAAIWASDIRSDDTEDSDILAEYTDLILNSLNKKGDAMMRVEGNCLSEDIAKKVWGRMRAMHHDQQGRAPFYYSAMEGKDDVHTIEQSLNTNPKRLTVELWDMLRKFQLCRTPSEELLHRFKFAKTISVPNTSFAKHVSHMLTCLLQSFPATRKMGINFVDGNRLRIDAGYFDSTWRIHDKWLTHAGAHETAYCDEPPPNDQQPFTCDHTVLELYDIMLSQLSATDEHPRVAAKEAWLKAMARARLCQMPRKVVCTTTNRKHRLRVRWESMESHRNKDKPVWVELHRSDCDAGKDTYGRGAQALRCDCPSKLSEAVNTSGVLFNGLDPEKHYFAHVYSDAADSFVALPPEPKMPRRKDRPGNHASKQPAEKAPTNAKAASPVGVGDDTRMLSDSESDPGQYGACGVPTRSPSPQIRVNFDSIETGTENERGISSKSSIEPAPTAVCLTNGKKNLHMSTMDLYSGEVHTLGNRIEHSSLDWGGTFPGSHVFYRTSNNPDKDIFILKPKPQVGHQVATRKVTEPRQQPLQEPVQQGAHQTTKRKVTEPPPSPLPKRRRFQAYVRDGSEELSEHGATESRELLPSSRPARSVQTFPTADDMDQRAVPSTSPLPRGGVNYRY